MTDKDWAILEAMLRASFRVQSDGIDEVAYRGLLSPYDFDEVKAAVVSMLGDEEWAPKVSSIVARLRERRPVDPLQPVRRPVVTGEAVLARVGVAPPWRIGERTFWPAVDSLRLTEGRRRGGGVQRTVSALGSWAGAWSWQEISGPALVWESWTLELIGAEAPQTKEAA